MGSVATRPGRSPALLKIVFDSLPFVVPSPSEALQPYSAVVVTGGSSGIGKSFIQLAENLKPDLLFCNLSRRAPAENIFPNAGKRLNHFSCDLSRSAELVRGAGAVRQILEGGPRGRILLVNNSGLGAFGAVGQIELARELEMIDVNVRAVVQLTGLLLPLLRSRGGAIINIASTVAFQPTPFAATYGATKSFVLHWTVALNEELRGTNVRALAVCPGTTATDFFRRAGSTSAAADARAGMPPEAVARCALRAFAGKRSQIVPGFGNRVYTFAGARLPKPLSARIAAKVLSRRRPKSTGP
jgi:short-subunit dehydrogenase